MFVITEKALVGAFSVITNLRMQFGWNFLKHYLTRVISDDMMVVRLFMTSHIDWCVYITTGVCWRGDMRCSHQMQGGATRGISGRRLLVLEKVPSEGS